jgi:hypothetical protein
MMLDIGGVGVDSPFRAACSAIFQNFSRSARFAFSGLKSSVAYTLIEFSALIMQSVM